MIKRVLIWISLGLVISGIVVDSKSQEWQLALALIMGGVCTLALALELEWNP